MQKRSDKLLRVHLDFVTGQPQSHWGLRVIKTSPTEAANVHVCICVCDVFVYVPVCIYTWTSLCVWMWNPGGLVPPVQGISMILIVEPSSFSNPDTCTQSKSMLAVCPNFSSRQIRAAVILFYMSAPDCYWYHSVCMTIIIMQLIFSDAALS